MNMHVADTLGIAPYGLPPEDGPSIFRAGRRLSRTGFFVLETLVHGTLANDGRRDEREKAEHLAWVAENLCALHGIQVVQHGSLPSVPAIYVANHVSYVEPIAILSKVRATAIAKREIGDWPMIGDAAKALGVLLVDRSCPASGASVLFEAWRRLTEGVSLVVFPEGTTTRGDEVLPFRRGVFGLSKLSGHPIVPIAVRYDTDEVAWVGDDPFLPHYVRTTRRNRTRVHLHFGEPIDPACHDGEAHHFAALSRSVIERMLALA